MNPDDQRTKLEAVQVQLEALMASETDGAKYAALSREYRQVIDTLAKLKPASTGSKVDELAKRRADRHADSAGAPPASRRSQPRRSG